MAAIRGKDTAPEMRVRKGLHARGLRFRVHDKSLPGRPDLVFRKFKVALFVNGCFWHAHEGCRYFRIPKTDSSQWKSKLEGNRQRDARNYDHLTQMGWRVLVVWECDIRHKRQRDIEVYLDSLREEIVRS